MFAIVFRLGAILFLSGYFTPPAEGARILGVFPFPAYSHYALGSRLMKALAEKGHDVTIITPYREKNPPTNYREIYLDGLADMVEERKREFFKKLDRPPISMMFTMNYMGAVLSEVSFNNSKVQKLLKDPNEAFDLVIVEQCRNDFHKGFAYHFNAPLIAFSTKGAGTWVNNLVGNPGPRSYIPDPLLPYGANMNFWQRLNNGVFWLLQELNIYFIFLPKMDQLLQKHFPGAPSVYELNKNVSLVFLNSHVSTNQPIPHVPNMIEIGGFHVTPPKKLPEDLQKYLDDAKRGVIYFSMGSNLQGKYLQEETKNSILDAFSKVDMKVLWKFEDDTLTGVPKNVRLIKWAPQQDILAHPNVKLFITHGGLLSTIEAVYHGVPILGIPMFSDQRKNMEHAVSQGFGRMLAYRELTEDSLLNGINEILQNAKYTENVKKRSAIMKDQPLPPLESAIFWTEYVIRHKGAPHFRSAALDLMWYQYHMIDVITFVFAATVSVFATLYYFLVKICRKKTTSKNIAYIEKKRN